VWYDGDGSVIGYIGRITSLIDRGDRTCFPYVRNGTFIKGTLKKDIYWVCNSESAVIEKTGGDSIRSIGGIVF
jgi:hypothetical protein